MANEPFKDADRDDGNPFADFDYERQHMSGLNSEEDNGPDVVSGRPEILGRVLGTNHEQGRGC